MKLASQSLTENRRLSLHGLLVFLVAVGLLTAISGSAVADSTISVLSLGPVAETNAGYIRPPALVTGKSSRSAAATTGPVAVAGAAATPAPQATPDPTAAPAPGYFTYTIQSGDTVDSIAAAYGIDPEYVIYDNPEITDPDSLIIGATMVIPAVDGVVYNVTLGDTVGGIASYYGVDTSDIVDYAPNNLTSPDNVVEGMVLVIPGAQLPQPVVEPDVAQPAAGSSSSTDGSAYVPSYGFIWPIYGNISQYFGEPELGSYHKGLDIEGVTGTAIAAAASGQVVLTAWDDYGLGYHVIVDHGNGIQTIYAHLSDIWVTQGQYVNQGDAVGALGSTGYSTGPHLHFQVNAYGSPSDPLNYLP